MQPGTTTAVFDLDSLDNTADLDMFVYLSDSCDPNDIVEEVGDSATGSADESVTIEDPEPGAYIVEVDGYEAGAQGSPIAYDLDYFGLGATPGVGSLTATPDPVPVVAGKKSTFTLSWSGLAADTRYRGSVAYAGSSDTHARGGRHAHAFVVTRV